MNPRREIGLFLSLTLFLSLGFYLYLALADRPLWNDRLSFAFMWCPGAAALLTRAMVARSLRGLGWGWGRTWRVALPVLAAPFLLGGLVYVLVWASGLGAFDPGRLTALTARLGLPGAWGWIAGLVLVPLGVVLSMGSTLGEELGWRGFLAERLAAEAGFVRASLQVGAIWALWHYPLILVLLPRYRPSLPVPYALACFTASVVGVSFFYTWLRHTTGSVWPVALLHAASTGAQSLFEALTRDTGPTPYLTYEYGIGFTVVIWIAVACFWRRMARAGWRATGTGSEEASLAAGRASAP